MLTFSELATVLAALRLWQRQLAREGRTFADGFPHFIDEVPLSEPEIDSLCARLMTPTLRGISRDAVTVTAF